VRIFSARCLGVYARGDANVGAGGAGDWTPPSAAPH
jgi:hypothetical protein